MAHLDSSSRSHGLDLILRGYKPRPGNFDEMMDGDGRVREHWRPFLTMLAALGPEEIDRRFAAADRHLRESGVFYRVYEDPAGVAKLTANSLVSWSGMNAPPIRGNRARAPAKLSPARTSVVLRWCNTHDTTPR